MKVQHTQLNPQQSAKQLHFKGAIDTGLRFFATNQAVGANTVDLCFMVAPRTGSDFKKRGPAAGFETLRRESMGTVNDSLIGIFGVVAGSGIAYGINKKYGLNVNEIFAAPDTLNILALNKSEQIKNNKTQLDYIKSTLSEVRAFNPRSAKADSEGYVRLSQQTIDEAASYLDKSLNNKMDLKVWKNNKTAEARNVLMKKITEDTGAQARYILESSDKKLKSITNLEALLNDIFIVSDSFNKNNVNSTFVEQLKNGKNFRENAFVKNTQKFMKTRAGMGFAIASAIGLSVQPINMYLTKRKTGTDGFVGVEGRTKDNSAGFKGLKGLSAAGFFSVVLATLKMSPVEFIKAPSKFMDKMFFTGKMPTVNQLKGVYGLTIISRILSARDKDELREVLTKDLLGFLSWLVLGDIVNKLTADGFEKTVMNYEKGYENCKNRFKRTFNASLKTRDELLIETLAKNGIKSTKEENGKTVAKKFSELLKDVEKLQPEAKKLVKKQLRVLNSAQVVGYLFSGLVLGFGIPNLNIYITNTLDKKRKAQKALEEQKQLTA